MVQGEDACGALWDAHNAYGILPTRLVVMPEQAWALYHRVGF